MSFIGTATFIGGAVGAGTGIGATMVGGGLIGAGVGYAATGDAKGAMMGAGVGAGAGWALPTLGVPALIGSGPTGMGAAVGSANSLGGSLGSLEQYGQAWQAGSMLPSPSIGAVTSATKGSAMSGLGTSLMLGQAGLSLANAFSSQGSAYQDKVTLSAEAKGLQDKYSTEAFKRWNQAKRGDTGGRETAAIHSQKVAGDIKHRGYREALTSTIGSLNNSSPNTKGRGKAAVGGSLAKLAGAGMKDRFQNLFGPSSTLHNFQREGLLNAAKGLSNLYAQERQVGMFQTQGQYANWQAENMASADRGAAIGGAISGMGNFMANDAYLRRITA